VPASIDLLDGRRGLTRSNRSVAPPSIESISDEIKPEAPLALYNAIRHGGYPFLLESVEKSDQRARFSFVGANPSAVVAIKGRNIEVEIPCQDDELKEFLAARLGFCVRLEDENKTLRGTIEEGFDLFDALRCTIPCSPYKTRFGRQAFLGGGIGYLAYDLVRERLRPDLGDASGTSGTPSIEPAISDVPDAEFGIFRQVFLFDHLEDDVLVAVRPLYPNDEVDGGIEEAKALLEKLEPDLFEKGDLGPISCSKGEAEPFEEAVRQSKEHILGGNIFQVVLSREAKVRLKNPDPMLLYRRLRRINPSPYTYILEFGNRAVVGASPETLFSVYDRKVTVNPIAGTCPRGGSPEEDELLARTMLKDEKERAEHVMLVDLGRNDVRAVSKSGTVLVENFMKVLQYSHVQHIESTVRGDLREECDSFDAARAVFPAGTLSGAPKLRAMEIIDELEEKPRGIYGGGIGYFSSDGAADFAIAIRSVILEGDVAQIQAGAGIVADSDPHREYIETERKMAAMKKALGVE